MIQDLVNATEQQMKAKLAEARAKFQHRGLKGDAVEDAVREFLCSFIPRRLAVGTGEVIDREPPRESWRPVGLSQADVAA